MNGLGKPLRKKSNPNNREYIENQSENAHVNKKSDARRPIFVEKPFSHTEKILRRKTTHFFTTSCFGVTNITTPI